MKRVLVFLFCVLPLIASAQCFEERFDSGKKLYNQGKYEEAKERFQRCFECDDKPSDKDSKLNEYIRLCDEKLSIKLSVSIKNLHFDAEPKDTEYSVIVNSNKDWSYSCDSDWCIISKNDNELLVSCKPNYNITTRECHIKVKALSKATTITVNQSGAKLELFLSNDTLIFDSIQSTKCVFVYTNADYWYYDSIPNWCDASKRQDTLFVTCHKNDSVINRNAKIIVSSNKQKRYLNVIQKVGVGKIKTTTNHIIFDETGGKDTLSIESNSPDFTWHIIDADWITVNKEQHHIIVECEPNSLPVSRDGAIVISVNKTERTIIIEQKPYYSVLDISDNVIEFEGEGGSKIVMISSNDEQWNFINTTHWCQVFKYGTGLKISVLPNNTNNLRQGFIKITTNNKSEYIAVRQKSQIRARSFVTFDSNPVGKPIYIDGVFYDRTPERYAIDSICHEVKIGRRLYENVVFDKNKELKYDPGFRYLILTASNSNHIGAMTGFMGTKHIGMFNHFQIGIPIDDILETSNNKSSYLYALGPSIDIFNHMSLYAGLGPELFSQDSTYKVDITTEFGAMIHFRQIMITFGYKMQRIVLNESEYNGFFAGLGIYFDRYCVKNKNNVIRSRVSNSRRWWSINYIYATNVNGVMFSDIGKTALRGYLKTLYIDHGSDIDKQSSLTGGFVFTPFPGFIDICTGVGLGWYYTSGIEWKGAELEAGFIINLWRFPLTIMFHEYEIEKSSQHAVVEFGIGFHFGEFGKNKQPQYYY